MANNYLAYKGESDTLFKRLLSYISTMDNEWIQHIRPASEESIELLKKLSKYDKRNYYFPKEYEQYLRKMGGYDGGLLSKVLLGFSEIEEILDTYEELEQESDEEIRSLYSDQLYLIIFNKEMGGELGLELSPDQLPAHVVDLDNPKDIKTVADSFEKLLFQCAFWNYTKYRHRVSLGSSINDITNAVLRKGKTHLFDILDEICSDFEMEKVWFSDCNHYIAANDDVCFIINSVHAGIGFIAGDEQLLVKKVMKSFIANTGLSVVSQLTY